MPQLNIDEKPFARVKSPLLRKAFALWDGKRGTHLMPRREDFDPVEMPRLLSSIILVDVGDVREKVLTEYRLPVLEKRPVFSDHEFRKLNNYHHTIERAIFPLSDDRVIVDKLIAFLDFERVRSM